MSITDKLSVLTGAARSPSLMYAAFVDDARAESGDPHSVVAYYYNGQWRADAVDSFKNWVVAGVSTARHPIQQGIYAGINGEVYCSGSGDIHAERVRDGKNSPEVLGPLRSASSIDGIPYVAGMARQVYRREDRDRWVCISEPIHGRQDESEFVGFDSVHGFSDAEIYAAGVFGEIWQFDGSNWIQRSSPTNLILSKVCCAGDGNVYMGGQKAVLLRGRVDAWESLEIDSITDDIWGLAWYRDALYVSTLSGLYRLTKSDELELVDLGGVEALTFYHLDVAEDVLWSFGRKDVLRFDGVSWTRVT